MRPAIRTFAAWALVGLLSALAAGPALAAPLDRDAWYADLDQLRDAMTSSYANLEWAAGERGMDLPAVYALARTRIAAAQDEAGARRAIDRFVGAFADGHFEVHWPQPAPATAASSKPAVEPLCSRLGYFDVGDARAIAIHLPGFTPFVSAGGHITAGLVEVSGRRVGVLRVPIFEPQGFPDICAKVLKTLALAPDSPCDEACEDKAGHAADALFMGEVETQVRALVAAKPDLLLVDLADNGGGNDSAVALARMLTAKPLRSPPMGFVRGPGWTATLARMRTELQAGLKTAKGDDRALLEQLDRSLDLAGQEAARTCDRGPLWRGQPIACTQVVMAPLHAAGLVDDAPGTAFAGKPWAETVSSTARFNAPERLWRGPLAVLLDDNSASATELLAAMFQDAGAALIVGSPSFGAGCGHAMDNGGPIKLNHSQAEVSMPDCVRLRADGRNEVGGIEPDLLIGFRAKDTPVQRLRRLTAAMPAIIERATAPRR